VTDAAAFAALVVIATDALDESAASTAASA
jgi:hypothetical protein